MQYDYRTNTHGHTWIRNEDGEIDIFAYDHGDHNGPRCMVCGYGFCHHCKDEPSKECDRIQRDISLAHLGD
jgi:hypothetical protein